MDLRRFVFKLGLLLGFVCSSIWADSNLLANFSFEDAGTGEPAANWISYQCAYERSSNFSKSGSWSAKITGNGGASEIGLGGMRQDIYNGLPPNGEFIISSNIYIDSYSQGKIYAMYVNVNFTDSTQKSYTLSLSSSDIAANMNTWKYYYLRFATDPNKTISSMVYWCLVWKEEDNKFIGTVYFDDVKIKVYKPAVYWKGSAIASAGADAAQDVLSRGYTHAVLYEGDDRVDFLSSNGFKALKLITPTGADLEDTPRRYSPYNDKTRYDAAKATLATKFANTPGLAGVVDDIEVGPFPSIRYSEGGGFIEYTYSDLQERIGNLPSQSQDWPVFKNWPNPGDHDVANLTMDNIEYNFPSLILQNAASNPTGNMIIGYYAPGDSYQTYEMAAQTFTPTDSRITRIDVMVRRYNGAYPKGNIYYYLTEVDANGKPDLTKPVSYRYCQIHVSETDVSATQNWNDITPIPLYFDPEEVGALNTSKQYALVLEFTKKDNLDWNGTFYYVGTIVADNYSGGQAWWYNYGQWRAPSSSDLWFKIYKPAPPYGYDLNQFHEDWIDFQCAVNARFVQDYCSIADAAVPARTVWVYSGYTNEGYARHTHSYDGTTRRCDSVNWEMLAAAGLDFALCGYGTRPITATVNALQTGNPSNPPKLIGGGYPPCGQTSFEERYNTCDGVMLYYMGGYTEDPGWVVP